MKLLAFDDENNALAEAVVVDVEQLSFSSEKRLFDKNDVFEICTRLRIVETRFRHVDGQKRDKLLAMKNILTEKGGQSLNLCPEESLED